MKEASDRIMTLCDPEEEYAQLMTEFLNKHKNLPWELHTYTNVEDMFRAEKKAPELLVVAESAFSREMQEFAAGRLVILGESGVVKWQDVIYVDKYQEAEEVLKVLLGLYAEMADVQLPGIRKKCRTRLIGNFTPVRRSMQPPSPPGRHSPSRFPSISPRRAQAAARPDNRARPSHGHCRCSHPGRSDIRY